MKAVAAAAAALALLLGASAAWSSILTTNADFVGCASDGVAGPVAAPATGPQPLLPWDVRLRLAYYGSPEIGVLAPEGWHCVGIEGSDGSRLIVTPERHDAADFQNARVIAGPAVEISRAFGGTSGRSEVAAAIARYFPQHRSFVRRVRRAGLGEGPFARGPWRGDRIERVGPTGIKFVTPAGRDGEGTNWLFARGGEISGAMVLLPADDPRDEPDLITVRVRLPEAQADAAWFVAVESAAQAVRAR